MEDEHFLSRLERVQRTQVELALSLYRDSSLVKFLLHKSNLPEGAHRVAISLESETEGPFLLVTRDGRFVTCLGKGMRVNDLPVVSRERLDELSDHYAIRNKSLTAARQFVAEGSAKDIYRKLVSACDELSREDFAEMALLEPVIAPLFLRINYEVAKLIQGARRTIILSKNPAKLPDDWARMFYGHLWTIGHLSTIAGSNPDRSIMLDFVEHIQDKTGYHSYHCVAKALTPVALRGIWTVGRLGDRLLPTYLNLVRDQKDWTNWLNGYLGCLMLATKNPMLRNEVREVFAEASQGDPSGANPQEREPWPAELIEAADNVFARPSQRIEAQRARGRAIAIQRGASLPSGSPYKFTHPEEVPDDLAMALSVNALGNTLENNDIVAALDHIPWLANAPAESIFLPKDYLKATKRSQLEPARRAVSWWHKGTRYHQPAKAEEKQGRNEICSCGSGKKFKKCHGA